MASFNTYQADKITDAIESAVGTLARTSERLTVAVGKALELYERRVIAAEQEAEYTRQIADSQAASVGLRKVGL